MTDRANSRPDAKQGQIEAKLSEEMARTVGVRISDLASVPDPLRPEDTTPAAVFGAHWPQDDPLLQRQLVLELDGWLAGMLGHRLSVERAIQAEEATRLSPYRKLLRHWIEPLAAVIDEYRGPYLTPNSGRSGGAPPKWTRLTAHLGAHEIASAALETIIGKAAIGKPMKQPALAHDIGKAIEHLHLVNIWQEHNPALLHAYLARLQEAGATKNHQEIVLRHGYTRKFLAGADDEIKDKAALWSAQERAEIGLALIRLAELGTGGRIRLDKESGKRRPTGKRVRSDQLVVTLDDETYDWIERALSRGQLQSTSLKPMLVEPRPWKQPSGGGEPTGGYFLDVGPATGLVRSGHRSARLVRKQLASSSTNAEPVYAALNLLGRTQWRINRNVLEIAQEARAAGLNLPGLPNALYQDEPPKPADIDTNEDARKKWRRERTRTIERNIALRGRVLRSVMTLTEAQKFVDAPAIYFPHHCDFRGRIYPMPTALNIQGPDLARALLEFADGEPLDEHDAEGVDWLAIHVANCFGQDKKAFTERIAWTRANELLLRRIASDPLGHRREWEAAAGDKLWMALAAAKEWVAFLDEGPGFVTRLPCFIDGTCNGLQHFAALGRDPSLASLVNLAPSSQPQDIYQAVADRASCIIAEKRKASRGEDDMARRWAKLLNGGNVPRALAKAVVMTKPYGVTHKGIMDCAGETMDRLDAQCVVFNEEQRPKARDWLAKALSAAMAGQLGTADHIMKWLKQTIAVATRHARLDVQGGAPGLVWVAPTGFPWAMAYGRKEKKTAHIRFKAERSTAVVQVENQTVLDPKAHGDAVAPNFVHALDASALVFALNRMERSVGVSGVGAIHDSICGLATQMSTIGEAVRDGFVELYSEHAPLRSFCETARAQIAEEHWDDLPEPPEPGEFNVNDVLLSQYFFA
jgi:DNA-directed RNA polymerase